MSRNRASAKKAGTWMETATTAHIAQGLDDDRIERRTKNGSKDRGDIGGVRTHAGRRVVIEVKNTAKYSIGTWLAEAETERINDGADIAVVVAKRPGIGETRMGDQLVVMTLDNLIHLLT